MKEAFQKLKSHPRYLQTLYLGKLFTITGSAQILIQLVSFISGILVIRLLTTGEYALYTLANTMLGTMTVLSDAGISVGVMAQGGSVWNDREKMGTVLATGLDLRKKFALGSLVISLPILGYLLWQHGASWWMMLLIVASIIPAFFAALSDSLYSIVPKLHHDIIPLQKNQVNVGVSRFVLTAISLFAFPWTFIAILASGIPRVFGNITLRKIAHKYSAEHMKPDPVVRQNILKLVKRLLPDAVYYCLAGQITIWLISIFGNTAGIAEIGALSRLAIVLNVLTVMMTTLVVPKFAKLPASPEVLLKRYFQIILAFVLVAVLIVGVSWLFSDQILWVLGKNYKGLNAELVLNMVASCLILLSSVSMMLYTSRNWAINPFISIPLSVASIIIGALIFDMKQLEGILYLNIMVGLVQFLLHTYYGLVKIRQLKNAR